MWLAQWGEGQSVISIYTTYQNWIQGVSSCANNLRDVTNSIDWSQGEEHLHFTRQLGITREACEANQSSLGMTHIKQLSLPTHI